MDLLDLSFSKKEYSGHTNSFPLAEAELYLLNIFDSILHYTAQKRLNPWQNEQANNNNKIGTLKIPPEEGGWGGKSSYKLQSSTGVFCYILKFMY